jgi:heme exporter protein CcmD
MLDLAADHVSFVMLSYGLVVVTLGAVVATTLRRAARLKRELASLNLSDPGSREKP